MIMIMISLPASVELPAATTKAQLLEAWVRNKNLHPTQPPCFHTPSCPAIMIIHESHFDNCWQSSIEQSLGMVMGEVRADLHMQDDRSMVME